MKIRENVLKINENSEKMPSSPFSSPCSHSDHPKTGVPGVSLHYCDTQSEIHRIVVGDLDNNVFKILVDFFLRILLKIMLSGDQGIHNHLWKLDISL